MIAANIASTTELIPRLENGDKLTRIEFERRYQAMPQHQKAELIEGIVYMASPLRFESHAEPLQEYLVWRVHDRQFDWFRLNNGEYIQLEPNADGTIFSQIFPGLWLDIET
ncbi:hypothetical protein VB691_11315 [Crocosphaera sp. XPORK-15E]|nr:hypothetical protein [Crocosphaera sp. XPORK-15E]MEA5534595.1 hypothetical protein [Crocosphaera sp. XPORK-15E]